ncbi:conserved hypothetical protein [Clostridium botulinum C str. Eklund]|uniref:type II toxin-antitoxin system PemK/MazF family toxin n=1 Tax=Clostridium botulinum TaxID=1491 RepID=UPI00016641C6|nr:type II toxin-antitoxin system PemK/MazF family toxin [Clostridium botulinum]EDS77118.1 conserved hypothetical protein [Clostridium botulinum C str. Eklund]KEH96536.1 hypothetical protein Z953_p0115 [Clostridium botulinum D str. 16868]
MCKVGDIILIKNYVDNEKKLDQHSFVVLSDESGKIQGLDYNIICNVMSSFKNKKQQEKKLQYAGNFPITHNDTVTHPDNGKDGYIKAEQLYYFNKDKLDYMVIGQIKPEAFNLLMEFIEKLDVEFKIIIDNL